ncbi:MAG: hypothetical protein QOH15_2804 [Gaiellales bacterium]|jgi:flagellar basal body rod protein FlgC|nr:hypothetical protein [Gaiellales bacterium]
MALVSPTGISPLTSEVAASSGMRAAEGRIDADAQSIATQGPDVGSMIDLNVQTVAFSALVQVIRASNEMTGSAIDLLA